MKYMRRVTAVLARSMSCGSIPAAKGISKVSDMKRVVMMLILCMVVLAVIFLSGCIAVNHGKDEPVQGSGAAETGTAEGNVQGGQNGQGSQSQGGQTSQSGRSSGVLTLQEPGKAYSIKTALKELRLADPEKRIGVYGRYTELTAEGDVPEALSRKLSEVNARAKAQVEEKAGAFLSDNAFPAAKADEAEDPFSYRNISYIVNVTRADQALFSILETEMESGIGDEVGQSLSAAETCRFHASVYDTSSGTELALGDFLQDPGSLPERLKAALSNKYMVDGLYTVKENAAPAWTADYLGLHFYLDGDKAQKQAFRDKGIYTNGAVHVTIPYTALDGALAEAAAKTPESFIAPVEKNAEYALPQDKRSIRVEKAADEGGYEAYRIVIREGKKEKAWWLEYADDASEYYVFRAQGAWYFYRLDDAKGQAYVYNFASPDGGFDRFENQNAQCFDSFLHELYLALPSDPECVHMRERTRKYMDAASGLNPTFAPNGHYSFLPEPGRGRTWLHFALIDDALALDTRNVGCRLLHEISGVQLDEAGDAGKAPEGADNAGKKPDGAGSEGKEIVIPAGEVLQFLRVDGESELYYYMSPKYNLYQSGARDYFYDCALSDGRLVRLVTRYENSFFVDGMYMDRIGEPVTLAAASYEAGLGEVQDHYVEIGGKKYKLIRDLSLKTEAGEEIDFAGDTWWKVENYVGTYVSKDSDARLVIADDGGVRFDFEGRTFTGKLPEKRYYRQDVKIDMEAGYERRTFRIIVEDDLPWHDPGFRKITFYSAGEPATNEPSKVPPIEVELVRKAGS